MTTEAPVAVIRCVLPEVRGQHEHGQGCWGMSDTLTHHRSVFVPGRDFQCACGVWGSAEPGYMGYQWHLESVIEEQAKSAVTPELLAVVAAARYLVAVENDPNSTLAVKPARLALQVKLAALDAKDGAS